MRGVAAVVDAQGQWTLNTSQAMIHAEEARRLAMENRLRELEISCRMKQVNKELRAAERASHTLGVTQIRNPKVSTPAPRTISLFDETGQIAWPTALQGDKYQNERTAIDGFFAGRSGGVSSPDQAEASECLRVLAERLQEDVRDVPGGQYTAAKRFLGRLAAEVDSGRDLATVANAHKLAKSGR